MAATIAVLELTKSGDETVPQFDNAMVGLALQAWQRGSSKTLVFDEQWVSAEESILLPH